jgi:hypothetical protein
MILAFALTLTALAQDGAPPHAVEAQLRAFVVDIDGALLVDGWHVSAQRAERDFRSRTTAPIDRASGVASFVGLEPGT